jgi:hypothetical protein
VFTFEKPGPDSQARGRGFESLPPLTPSFATRGKGAQKGRESSSGAGQRPHPAPALHPLDVSDGGQTLAPDYSVKLLDGQVLSREQVKDFLKKDMARTRAVEKSSSAIDGLRVTRDEAVVIVTHEASRVLDDQHGVPHQ